MTQLFRLFACCLLALIIAGTYRERVHAQAGGRPAFSVASVKANKSGQRGYSLPPPVGGRLIAANLSLKALTLYAYHLQDPQLIGANGWMSSDTYDIEAKADGSVPESSVRLMVQVLLEDRFKLKVHGEMRQLSTYALRVAKNGLRMRASTENCSSPDSKTTVLCGGLRMFQRRQLTGRNVPLDELVQILSTLTGRMVVDKTGLTDNFDVKLEWTPDEALALGAEAGVQSDTPQQAALFTALEEQLGLRLQSEKGPVPVVVIDSAEGLPRN
jgi:uncharacterized protein (TIGR03435 family)